jgi:hypothetical protein
METGSHVPVRLRCNRCLARKPARELTQGLRLGLKWCDECVVAHADARKYARQRTWREKNRTTLTKQTKAWRVRRLYGLSLQEHEAMLKKPCCLCGDKARAVDHDHKTGAVRGPLCIKCNTGLGAFNDDPALLRIAAEYIELHRGEK